MITTELWKENEGANLRNFHEEQDLKSVNGALALRKDIEKIIDKLYGGSCFGIHLLQ